MSERLCRQCKCADCGHQRWGRERAQSFTREFQQAARSHVKREHLVRNGKKSFQIMVEKHGFNWAAEIAAAWRRKPENMSKPMRIVKGWLDERGEYYLMDQHLKYGVYPDFNLPKRSVIVEVDGKGFHERTAWLGEGENRQRRDEMKDRLYAIEGYRVLRLCESCVRDGSGQQLLINCLAEVRA